MKKIEFSESDCKMIVEMYMNGMSAVRIGKEFGCSRTPIKKILKEQGIALDTVLRKIPKSDYHSVVNMYNSGMTTYDIANYYGCSTTIVSGIIKQMNGVIRENGFTKEDADAMNDLYIQTRSLKQVGILYGCHGRTVGRVLRKYGYETDRRIFSCDEHYFDVIDTPNKAYILGLLWSDGYNDVVRGQIKIQLQDRDKSVLERINIEVDSDRPLRMVRLHNKNSHWRDSYTLTLNSGHMSSVLESYGMTQNKSLTLEFPSWLDPCLYRHFIRGYFDGDGSVCFTEKTFSVSAVGTPEFLGVMQKICTDIGIKSTVSPKKNRNPHTCQWYVTNRQDMLSFLRWIYDDSDLKIERKYQKYLEALIYYQNINNSHKINELAG